MRWDYTLVMVRKHEVQSGRRFRSRERAIAALRKKPQDYDDGKFSERWMLVHGPLTATVLGDGTIAVGPSWITREGAAVLNPLGAK